MTHTHLAASGTAPPYPNVAYCVKTRLNRILWGVDLYVTAGNDGILETDMSERRHNGMIHYVNLDENETMWL
jgi:hypothetical protein